MRLMIVDDHAGVRKMLRLLAARAGDTVCECATGDEAARMAAAFKPDGVTLDVRMPGMCCFEAARAIQAAHPASRIVVVTSHDEPYLRQMAQEAGIVNYMIKDNLAELRAALTGRSEKTWPHPETGQLQEDQRQRLEAIGALASGIAHDYNNLLAAIVAYTELACLEADEGKDVRPHLIEIRRAGARAKDLVQQLLAYSRQQKPELRPLRLQPVVEEALQLLAGSLPPNVEVQTRIDASAPLASADATQIHQVVMNLCANALHALREHGGRLFLGLQERYVDPILAQTVPHLRTGRFVQLTVRDNGHGMSPEVLERIFEPFFTTKAPGEGTGLGLPLIYGIVREHGGAIAVGSEPGIGTTFDVFIPALGGEAITVPSLHDSLPRGLGETVLLVDDDVGVRTSMQMILSHLGYEVVTHSDPTEALQHFRMCPQKFDLALADLTMPGMSGFDLARHILKERPEIPVLLASGFAGSLSAEQIDIAGVRALLAKPITISILAQEVRKALDSALPK